ncbi:MAG: right-handed parallel beta-helix repeat-containing protein [Pseudomonadota bacterium]|nr:right-handed parallel beta-helix repeat-containing protein [Pseudomonadota bacterium]
MTSRSINVGSWIVVAVLQLFCASFVYAQATRTWVSGVGDDANPCSRTAPCKTFAGAISKTAAGGEINALDPAGFGAVTITKAITITGDGTMAGVLVSGTNGIVVQAGASDVVILRNLHINGLGTGLNGIRFLSGAELHVEHCEIRGFSQQGIDIAPSGSGKAFVGNTELRDNAAGAIYVHPGASAFVDAMLDHVLMQGNARGLRAEDGSIVAVHGSTAAENTNNGFVALAAVRAVDLTISDSVSSLNGAVGVYSGALSTVRISNVTISGNNVGLQSVSGGAIVSFGNNSLSGNASNGSPTSTIGRI